MKKTNTPAVKTSGTVPAGQVKGGKFEPKQFVKQGLSEEDVIEIKNAFDLFDTDQGGSVDTKCNHFINDRTESSYDFIGIRI